MLRKSGAFIVGLLLAQTLFADDWNKKTRLTVNETVTVPGATLPPGKYVMKLVDSLSDRHIVQITNEQENQVLTTILAIPNYRLKPKGNSELMWWETPAGNPRALRAWFYPGDNFGQEFVYPKGLSAKIAESTHMPVPTSTAQTSTEMKTAPVTVTQPSGKETQLTAEAYRPAVPEPAPKPEATPAPVPVPTVVETPAELPATGSPYVGYAIAGLLVYAAGYALRIAFKRPS